VTITRQQDKTNEIAKCIAQRQYFGG
jgi:hypothetical protein